MKHRTLWAYGCSHTLGHGLWDCIGEDKQPINKPSELAWPAQLGKLLDIPVKNCAAAGIGCATVWHEVVTNTQFAPDDIVVIMWPCWETRPDILLDSSHPRYSQHAKNIIDVRTWKPEDNIYFLNYYSEYHQLMHWYLYVNHINHYLQHKVLLFQTVYRNDLTGISGNLLERPTFDHNILLGPAFGEHKYRELGLAEDNQHLGEQAHAQYARDLLPIIQERL